MAPFVLRVGGIAHYYSCDVKPLHVVMAYGIPAPNYSVKIVGTILLTYRRMLTGLHAIQHSNQHFQSGTAGHADRLPGA